MGLIILALFALLIAAFVTIPLYFGFWPIGIISAIIATIMAVGYAYISNDQGEEGFSTFILSTLALGCVWFGVLIAGIVHWLT